MPRTNPARLHGALCRSEQCAGYRAHIEAELRSRDRYIHALEWELSLTRVEIRRVESTRAALALAYVQSRADLAEHAHGIARVASRMLGSEAMPRDADRPEAIA